MQQKLAIYAEKCLTDLIPISHTERNWIGTQLIAKETGQFYLLVRTVIKKGQKSTLPVALKNKIQATKNRIPTHFYVDLYLVGY